MPRFVYRRHKSEKVRGIPCVLKTQGSRNKWDTLSFPESHHSCMNNGALEETSVYYSFRVRQIKLDKSAHVNLNSRLYFSEKHVHAYSFDLS